MVAVGVEEEDSVERTKDHFRYTTDVAVYMTRLSKVKPSFEDENVFDFDFDFVVAVLVAVLVAAIDSRIFQR